MGIDVILKKNRVTGRILKFYLLKNYFFINLTNLFGYKTSRIINAICLWRLFTDYFQFV